jgi:hypothetical protein
MRLSWIGKSLAICVALSLSVSACAVVEAQRKAEEAKKEAFVHRVDMAHVWVTTGGAPAGRGYDVLGPIKYTVPFSPDAIDAQKQQDKLKQLGLKQFPDTIDALIDEKTDVSSDGSMVTVSATAIQYHQSVDRNALHHMNEGIVASPSGD